MKKTRVGILISGRGSNMQALVEAAQSPDFPAQIVVVGSNKAEAAGLNFAQSHGISTFALSHRDFATREAFDEAIHAQLLAYDVEYVCLAGFMRILTPWLCEQWEGRMLNIHPSLLPNYKGLHTHARVLADGGKEHGCTVHFVTAGLDDGPIVAQARVPVLQNDAEETLAARVLLEEHKLYPEALRLTLTSKLY